MRPPTVNPPGGLMCVRKRAGLLLAGCALLAAVPVHDAAAQFIRGTIRAQGTQTAVQGASITVLDSLDHQLVAVLSDDMGHFVLPLASVLPFKVTVRKIGWQPSTTDLIRASPTDTLDMDLVVPVEGVKLADVEINATKTKSMNQQSYAEAKKLGWRVYEPSEVEAHRNEFSSFENMLRALSVTGVQMPSLRDGTSAPRGCYINIRNGRCFTFVVDGQPVGTMWVVNPSDVYFLAILQASESSVQFGDKAPWGAILVVTRMNGDKKNP
jgi:hypothetical protein